MTELEAIKWYEDLIAQTDDILPECSEALQAEMVEQRKATEVAISALHGQHDQKNGGWISVKDRLPKWLEDCLCYVMMPEKGGFSRSFRILHQTEVSGRDWNCTGMIVTHWQPLPEPPKEDAE